MLPEWSPICKVQTSPSRTSDNGGDTGKNAKKKELKILVQRIVSEYWKYIAEIMVQIKFITIRRGSC